MRDRDIVGKLFDELGPCYAKRKGDYAPMAPVTLLDRPEPKKPAEEKKAA